MALGALATVPVTAPAIGRAVDDSGLQRLVSLLPSSTGSTLSPALEAAVVDVIARCAKADATCRDALKGCAVPGLKILTRSTDKEAAQVAAEEALEALNGNSY